MAEEPAVTANAVEANEGPSALMSCFGTSLVSRGRGEMSFSELLPLSALLLQRFSLAEGVVGTVLDVFEAMEAVVEQRRCSESHLFIKVGSGNCCIDVRYLLFFVDDVLAEGRDDEAGAEVAEVIVVADDDDLEGGGNLIKMV